MHRESRHGYWFFIVCKFYIIGLVGYWRYGSSIDDNDFLIIRRKYSLIIDRHSSVRTHTDIKQSNPQPDANRLSCKIQNTKNRA